MPPQTTPNDVLVRVLLADDHAQTRAGLRRHLERSKRIVVVGEAANGHMALTMAEHRPADVLLLDIDMTPMSGLEVMRRLSETAAQVRVLGLSNYNDPACVFEMLAYGAAGYLSKEDATSVIVEAVCRVASGQRCQLSARLWSILSQRASSAPRKPIRSALPRRLREVIRLVASGYPDAAIAALLKAPLEDVQKRIAKAHRMFTLRDRAELVAWGWEQGFVDPPAPIRIER